MIVLVVGLFVEMLPDLVVWVLPWYQAFRGFEARNSGAIWFSVGSWRHRGNSWYQLGCEM